MYKDLSLKEKAKVLLYGGKLGLTSVEDIAKLYDDAIGSRVILDNNGYYAHPRYNKDGTTNDMLIKGDSTGTSITTRDIPFKIAAWDNLGNYQELKPNGEYYFPGSMVREHALSGHLALEGKKFNKKWKALDNIKYHVYPDTTFTRDKTGYGSIEVFDKNNGDTIRYPNGYTIINPYPGENTIYYNPKYNDEQDIRLDALHLMYQDPVYDALNSEYRYWSSGDVEDDAIKFRDMDMKRYGKAYPLDVYIRNEQDALLRNAFIEGDKEYVKSKNYDDVEQLHKDNWFLMPYIDKIHSYLVTGERPLNLLPEVVITPDEYKKGGNLFLERGFINRIKPIEEYITPLEPVTPDNTAIVLKPVYTPQEKSYAAALLAFYERHKSPEAEEKTLRKARLTVKDLKAAEFGTLDTPQSSNLLYAWRRFNNAKGSELLYPIPGVGEAMFGVDVADKLYSGDYGSAASALALYGAMTYVPEIAGQLKNIYITPRFNKDSYIRQVGDDAIEDMLLHNAMRSSALVDEERQALGNLTESIGKNKFSLKKKFEEQMFSSGRPFYAPTKRGGITVHPYFYFNGKVVRNPLYIPKTNTNYIVKDPKTVGQGVKWIESSHKGHSRDARNFAKQYGLNPDEAVGRIMDPVYNGDLNYIPLENFGEFDLYRPLTLFNKKLPLYRKQHISPINDIGLSFSKGGSIYIKPENRGKFTALKKRTGHSASWFKAHGTPALRKMATFALNARHWKHLDGGYSDRLNNLNWKMHHSAGSGNIGSVWYNYTFDPENNYYNGTHYVGQNLLGKTQEQLPLGRDHVNLYTYGDETGFERINNAAPITVNGETYDYRLYYGNILPFDTIYLKPESLPVVDSMIKHKDLLGINTDYFIMDLNDAKTYPKQYKNVFSHRNIKKGMPLDDTRAVSISPKKDENGYYLDAFDVIDYKKTTGFAGNRLDKIIEKENILNGPYILRQRVPVVFDKNKESNGPLLDLISQYKDNGMTWEEYLIKYSPSYNRTYGRHNQDAVNIEHKRKHGGHLYSEEGFLLAPYLYNE